MCKFEDRSVMRTPVPSGLAHLAQIYLEVKSLYRRCQLIPSELVQRSPLSVVISKTGIDRTDAFGDADFCFWVIALRPNSGNADSISGGLASTATV